MARARFWFWRVFPLLLALLALVSYGQLVAGVTEACGMLGAQWLQGGWMPSPEQLWSASLAERFCGG